MAKPFEFTDDLGPEKIIELYDPATDTYNTVPFTDSDDLFCAGHTFLPDGRLIAGGGANPGQVDSTHIFDPTTETWSHFPTGQMNNFRWYPTMVAMNDGRTAILSGTPGVGTVADIEVIDMSAPTPAWQTVTGGNKPFSGLYPGFHWLPSGGMFFTRTGWNSHTLARMATAIHRPPHTTVLIPVSSLSMAASDRSSGRSSTSLLMSRIA